jgi:hypothetical protein
LAKAARTRVESSPKGISRQRRLFCIFCGRIIAANPRMSSMLAVFEPMTSATARSAAPLKAETRAIISSGAQVPKATMVSPTASSDIPSLRAIDPALPGFFSSLASGKLLDFTQAFEVESRLVTAQSYSEVLITDHANQQMSRRGIGIDVVRAILRDPEQVIEVRPERVVLQSQVKIDNRSQLVRVFIDIDASPMRVVTVYRTSKIDKYWSRP